MMRKEKSRSRGTNPAAAIAYLLGAILIFSGCEEPIPPNLSSGPEWVVFTRENSPLASNAINAIATEAEGTVWFCTDDGLSRRTKSGGWETFRDEVAFQTFFTVSRKVNAAVVGSDQSVWFGLAGGGLRRFDRVSGQSAWTSHTTPSLSSDMVYALTRDIVGDIWCGTAKGVSRFTPTPTAQSRESGFWRIYGQKNSLVPEEPVQTVALNPHDNYIWFGTYSNGIVMFDGDADWNIDSPSDAPFPIVSAGFASAQVAYLGTNGNSAYRYNVETAEWMHLSDTSTFATLPDDVINAIVGSRSGEVWIGTSKGLLKLSGSKLTSFTSANSPLPNDAVRSLAFDVHGNLWIGTLGGAAKFREGGTAR